jgi:hypothetical protein
MLKAASADVGYKEGANNDTKHGRWYGLNYQPWCDMAVSKWGADSGNADVVGHFAYCPSHVNWFKARGQWHTNAADAKAGDVVFFTWDGGPVADHVGVVRKDAAAGHDVPTIEGNTSSGTAGSQGNGDGCYERTRPRNVILGFGRPAYKAAAKPSAPAATGLVVFPGAAWFKTGRKSPIVKAMRKRLIAVGCNLYKSSADPDVIGEGDKRSYEAWQRKCGYTGASAEWPPGKASWDKLRVPKG